MADPSQYLVHPDTGETVVVDPEWVERAKAKQFTPASEQQIKAYDARVAVAEAPITSAIKSIGEQALEAIAPTSLLRGAALMGGLRAKEEAEIARTGREIMAAARGKPVEPPTALETTMAATAKPLLGAAEMLEPLTPTGAIIRAGITTPEAVQARVEVLGRVPEAIPFVGSMPVTSLVGLAGAVTVPGGLSRLGKSLSGKSLGAKALAAEEEAAAAAAQSRQLAIEGAAGPVVAEAQKVAENAALKVTEAADAAAARRALLAKVPGGERIAQTIEKALEVPDQASALNVVNRLVGGPIARATEQSTRTLAALAPGLRASPVAQEIVTKAISQGAGSAADMALFSLGVTSQEDILGDHKMTAERALANMGHAIIDGAFLGAVGGALPPATSASLDALGRSVRGINNWIERNIVRPGVKMTTEARPESVDVIAERRADLGRPVGELLAEEMERREPMAVSAPVMLEPTVRPAPFEPGLPPQRIVPEVGMLPVTAGKPIVPFPEMLPEAPLPMPEPIKAPTLSPVEMERASLDFATYLEQAKKAMLKAQKEFTPIRSAEERALIDDYYSGEKILKEQIRQASQLKQSAVKIGQKKLDALMTKIKDDIEQVPRNKILQIADEITGRINALGEQDAGVIPVSTMKNVEALVQQLRDIGKSKKSPSSVADTAGTVARSLFELGRGPREGVTITLQEQRANRLAFDAGHLVRDFLIDPEMFGPAAARELSIRTALTSADVTMQNLIKRFGKRRKTGPTSYEYVADPGKIYAHLEQRGTPSAVLGDQAINDFRNSMRDMYLNMKESAKYYRGETMIPELGVKLGNMAKAFDAAEAEAVKAASNKALEQEFAAKKAERQKLIKDIKAEQSARDGLRDDLERRIREADKERADKAKLELEQWKVDNSAKKAAADARIEAWDVAEKARLDEVKAQQDAFDAEVKRRRDLTREEAGKLTAGSSNPLIEIARKGTIVAKDPVRIYKSIAAIERAAKLTESKAKSFANAVVKTDRLALAALKPAKMSRTPQDERKEYAERSSKLLKLANDPDEMARHLERVTEATVDAAPKISGHVKDVTSAGIMSLVNSMPAPPPTLSPYQKSNWQPTDAQVREFNRKYDAVTDPTSVLYRMAQGSATKGEIDTVNQVYGNLMRDVRQNVIDSLGDQKNIPADRRMILSQMLGIDVDGAPALGLTAQSVYGSLAQPPPQKQQQMPVSRAKGLRVAERSAEYDTNARQNAQLGARRGYGP